MDYSAEVKPAVWPNGRHLEEKAKRHGESKEPSVLVRKQTKHQNDGRPKLLSPKEPQTAHESPQTADKIKLGEIHWLRLKLRKGLPPQTINHNFSGAVS